MFRRFLGVTAAFAAALLTASITFTTPIASADADVQSVGTVPIPDGPAPSWIVADVDTGQVLAGREQYVTHAPASTIKTLLALVAIDELPLDATVVATEADANVECNCAGVKAGRTYTTRNSWTACSWCRATTPPTRWRTCSGVTTSRWPR